MKRYNDGPRVHFIVKDLVNPFRFQSIYTILQAYKPVYESLNVILQGGGGGVKSNFAQKQRYSALVHVSLNHRGGACD